MIPCDNFPECRLMRVPKDIMMRSDVHISQEVLKWTAFQEIKEAQEEVHRTQSESLLISVCNQI